MSWDGIRQIICVKNFDEMEIIGTMHFSVAVPIEADPEFKAMVLAAGVTHSGGNKSIDYTFRRYGDKFLKRFDPDRTCPHGCIKELLLILRKRGVNIAKILSSIEIAETNKHGMVSAANALIRLQATFHASVQLSLNGLGIEAEAVIRQGLEQIAWGLRVLELDEPEQVLNTKPNSSIFALKSEFPGAGFVYGMLSDAAHLAPRTHDRFISFSEGGVEVTIRDPNDCATSVMSLLLLLDAYSFVAQQVCITAGSEARLATVECEKLIDIYEQVLPGNSREWFHRWRGIYTY